MILMIHDIPTGILNTRRGQARLKIFCPFTLHPVEAWKGGGGEVKHTHTHTRTRTNTHTRGEQRGHYVVSLCDKTWYSLVCMTTRHYPTGVPTSRGHWNGHSRTTEGEPQATKRE